MRLTVKVLITHPLYGLGYCCLWAFFRRYTSTAMIALRLGTTKRAIIYAKHKGAKEGCLSCPNCMKKRLGL